MSMRRLGGIRIGVQPRGRVLPFATLAIMTVTLALLAAPARGECKWFRFGGFAPNTGVQDIISSDPACLSINAVSISTDGAGFVAFELCPAPICIGCSGDVFLTVRVNDVTRTARMNCGACVEDFVLFSVPDADACIANICTNPGGGGIGSAIDVSGCVLAINEEECAGGFPAKLIPPDAGTSTNYGIPLAIDGDRVIIGKDPSGSPTEFAHVYRRDGSTWVHEEALIDPPDDDSALDLAGDVVVIGASNDSDLGTSAGAVYVFHRLHESWIYVTKLLASDGAAGDRFGRAVATDGQRIIVGSKSDGNGPGSRSAYVFRREGNSWVEEVKLSHDLGDSFNAFGIAMEIDGDRCIVGYVPGSGGSALVYRLDGRTWTEEAVLTGWDGQASSECGSAVGISGDHAILGDVNNLDSGAGGAVYVFRRAGTAWEPEDKLLPSETQAGAIFGFAAAIDGDMIVVGSSSFDTVALNAGAAYFFHRDIAGTPGDPSDDTWVQSPRLDAPDAAASDVFGRVVDVSRGTVIVGAIGDDDVGPQSGAAYVYSGPGGPDCDASGTFDACEIHTGALADCNRNGAADICEIATGVSIDCDGNEIPDECEITFTFSDESALLGPVGDGAPQSFTIPAALPASGDVVLTFGARGDFGSASEYIDVDINGTPAGAVLVTSIGDCAEPYDWDQLIVPAGTFNGALGGGDAVIGLTPSPAVDAGIALCPSFVHVRVEYDTIPPADIDADGVHDACVPPCLGDTDDSGTVDIVDLLGLLAAWGSGDPAFDIAPAGAPDGTVDIQDLLALLSEWGPC